MSKLELMEQITMVANSCQEAVTLAHELSFEVGELKGIVNTNNLAHLKFFQILGELRIKIDNIEKRLDQL